jgi:cobalamin biosynthesis Mg chelatase CobN
MKVLKTSLVTNETRPKNEFKKDISAQIFEKHYMAERDKRKFNPLETEEPVPEVVSVEKTAESRYVPKLLQQKNIQPSLLAQLQEQSVRPLPNGNGVSEPPLK